MIITRKRFEEELAKRRQEEEFQRRIAEDIYRLNDEVRQLKFQVSCLESRQNTGSVCVKEENNANH